MENFGIILGLFVWGPFWLFFSVVVGQRASHKGRSFALGFVLSLFLSPLVGELIVNRMRLDERQQAQVARREAQGAFEREQRELERTFTSPPSPPRR